MKEWYQEKLSEDAICLTWNSFFAFRSAQTRILKRKINIIGNGDGDMVKVTSISWALVNDTEYDKWLEVAKYLSKSSQQVHRFETGNQYLIDSGVEEDYATYRNLRYNLINNEATMFFRSLQDRSFGYNVSRRYPRVKNQHRRSGGRGRVGIIINTPIYSLILFSPLSRKRRHRHML
jgi:hypothetical protein